ncbi:MAG: bile acid:sodium symporter family protein [Bacteroidales bacterium]|jgi:BASS family bile acid:Na+ symporter|nr:bile acid:sodium symporter family protein [Bacteroidales bacterium]HOL97443.1 bile acid:sodium symporter family protein [Bacteroidales bacterium]HOM36037.1 bile acid:sodium symporter family protein [Bacteroidales bacterium]HPD23347.1 bile acid:sodium symporter family protein [Bacteroidales bacterium]HRS99717.1 bile acid:sodium symporter family protein [Bacteroidales bacterium]
MFESLQAMDSASLNFSQGGLFVLNITIGIIMFGVALEIKMSHFKELLKKPIPIIVGILSQFVVLPLITFLLIIAFWDNITVGVAMGMILVAACPGGNVSNFISTLAKGNAALSVTLTAIATMMAIFFTPLNFYFWGKLYNDIGPWSNNELLRELVIDPVEMFKTVVILLGIPILLGMLTNQFLPRFTEKIKKPIKIFSIIFFMGMVVIMFANNYNYFIKYIYWIFLIVLIHNGMAFFSGWSFAKIFRLNSQNCRTISIETGIQNSGLGLVLLFNPKIFPQDLALGGMMIVTAWWGIWHIISGLTIASIWKNK